MGIFPRVLPMLSTALILLIMKEIVNKQRSLDTTLSFLNSERKLLVNNIWERLALKVIPTLIALGNHLTGVKKFKIIQHLIALSIIKMEKLLRDPSVDTKLRFKIKSWKIRNATRSQSTWT